MCSVLVFDNTHTPLGERRPAMHIQTYVSIQVASFMLRLDMTGKANREEP